MRKKSLLMIFVLVISFALTIVTGNNVDYESNTTANADSIQTQQANGITTQTDEATVTMRDIAEFLKDKKEHYPLSDEFIERYQQTSGGYLDTAKKAGLVVDKEKHEPNQKWHFFESWLYPSIEDGTLTYDESAKSRVYSKLLCPELLLWIYEACGVDPVKVKAAKDVVEQGKAAKLATTTIAKNMRGCVAWEDLENGIKNYTPIARVTLNPSKLQLTVGDESTITATVISSEAVGEATWSVVGGEDVISITPSGNQATVSAIAKGAAKVKVSYGDLTAECTVTVKEQSRPIDPSTQTSVKYVITDDLGTGKRTKTITSPEALLEILKQAVDGDGIIVSVDQLENIYGGGYGGSGDNAWYVGDVLKFGTASVNGSLTFTLNTEVYRVIITGYVSSSACKLTVNDNEVVCSEMTETSKEAIDGEQASTIVIDIESARTLTIATTNKKPLYITSIEFVMGEEAAQ